MSCSDTPLLTDLFLCGPLYQFVTHMIQILSSLSGGLLTYQGF